MIERSLYIFLVPLIFPVAFNMFENLCLVSAHLLVTILSIKKRLHNNCCNTDDCNDLQRADLIINSTYLLPHSAGWGNKYYFKIQLPAD